MAPVVVTGNADRAIVKIEVDFIRVVPPDVEAKEWDETALPLVEGVLAKSRCVSGMRFGEVVLPDVATRWLLAARCSLGAG